MITLTDKEYVKLITMADYQVPHKPVWNSWNYVAFEPYCQKCGNELDEGDKVCPECGQRIDWSDGKEERT